METKFTADHFIRKFHRIPDNLWGTGSFTDSIGRHCALGHCGMSQGSDGRARYTVEGYALRQLAVRAGYDVPSVNDGKLPEFEQESPKERILAMLAQIKWNQNQKEKAA